MLEVVVEQPKVIIKLLLLELVEPEVVVQVVNQILLLQQVMELTEQLILVVEAVELLTIMVLEEMQLKVQVDQV
jgi:hypothetical protein